MRFRQCFLLSFLVLPLAGNAQPPELPRGARVRLGTLQFRHIDWVQTVAFADEDRSLLSSGGDTVLWDLKTGSDKRRYRQASLLAVSRDRKVLAFGWEQVSLVACASGKVLLQLQARDAYRCAAFAGDGKTFVTSGDKRWIRIWSTATGKQLRAIKSNHGDDIKAVAMAPDGKTFFSLGGHVDRCLHLWDAATGKLSRQLGGIERALYSPDGATIIAASGGEIIRWDVATGKEPERFRGSAMAITALAISPDSNTLALAGYGDLIRIFDLVKGAQVQWLPWTGTWVNALTFSTDGKTVAAGGGGKTVRLWEWRTRKELFDQGHQSGVGTLTFAPDSRSLISLGWDQTIRVWDVAAGKESRRWGNSADTMALAPDGKSVVLGSGPGYVSVLDLRSGKERHFKISQAGAHPAAISPDGKSVLTVNRIPRKQADGLTCTIWDIAKGEQVRRFAHAGKNDPADPEDRLGGRINAAAFAADNRTFAAAWTTYRQERMFQLPRAHGVGIWDIATGNHQALDAAATRLTFLPDGKTLVTVGDDGTHGLLRFWDVAQGKELRRHEGPREWGGVATFSADGELFANSGGSHDRSVYVWRTSSGRLLRRFHGHRGEVHSLAFSPDGRMLASGSGDTTILVWEVLGLR